MDEASMVCVPGGLEIVTAKCRKQCNPLCPGGIHKQLFFFLIYDLVKANHDHKYVYVVKEHARVGD